MKLSQKMGSRDIRTRTGYSLLLSCLCPWWIGAYNPLGPPLLGLLKNLGIVIARSQGGRERGRAMTTKQSARLHRKSANRDCFVVLHTLHHPSALLAMTRSGLFRQSLLRGKINSLLAHFAKSDLWGNLYYATDEVRG